MTAPTREPGGGPSAPARSRARFGRIGSTSKTGYDAFISYNRGVDAEMGRALRHALHKFACPWYRLRALRVFLDDASLNNSGLWSSVRVALDRSEFFVLLASPAAAASSWVQREINHWLDRNSPDRLLIAITEGNVAWDNDAEDFDWAATTALPRCLSGVFTEQPRYSDLRQARADNELTLSFDSFRGGVADLASRVHDLPKDELVGEDVRQHRKTIRVTRAAIAVLLVLSLVATIAAITAVRQRDTATQQRDLATARQITAQAAILKDTEPGLARQLLVAAHRIAPNPEVTGALLAAGDIPKIDRPHLSGLRGMPGDRTIHADGEGGIEFLPQANAVLVAGYGGLRTYDADTLAQRAEVTINNPVPTPEDLSLDAAGVLAAVANSDGLRLYDVRDPGNPRLRSVQSGNGQAVAWQPGMPRVALGGRGGATVLFDVSNPDAPTVVAWIAATGTESTYSMAFSADGRVLAVSTDRVRLFRLDDSGGAEPVAELPEEIGSRVTFSPTQPLLAARIREAVQLWDVTDPARPTQTASLIGHTGLVEALAFSPDGRLLASGADDLTARIWDAAGHGQLTPLAVLPHTEHVRSTAFAPDGRTLATRTQDDLLRLWPVSDPRHRGATAALPGHVFDTKAIAASADRTLIATGDGKSTVSLWDNRDPYRPGRNGTLTVDHPVTDLAISADHRVLAVSTGRDSPRVRLFNIGDPARPLPLGTIDDFIGQVDAIALSGDGRQLAAGDTVGQLVIYDIQNPADPKQLSKRRYAGGRGDYDIIGRLVGLAFDPHRPILISASTPGWIRVWNVADPGKPVPMTFTLDEGEQVRQVAFSPDGGLLTTTAFSGRIRLWRVSELDGLTEVSRVDGQGDGFNATGFDEDGRQLIIAGGDRSLRLYDISRPARPTLAAILPGNGEDPQEVLFGPRGQSILLASQSSTVDGWSLDIDGMTRRLCAGSGPTITEAQWQQYLPGRPYDPPCRS